MADQAITALPKKTYSGSSQIASTDYLLGIDSAEGYQMLIQDLGEYIINRATASLAGSTQTLASAISALNSKTYSLSGGTALQANADLNTLGVGNYYSYSTITVQNGPMEQICGIVKVEHSAGTDNAYLRQIYRRYNADYTYERIKDGNTWKDWIKLPTRAEMDDQKSKFSDYKDITATTSNSGSISLAPLGVGAGSSLTSAYIRAEGATMDYTVLLLRTYSGNWYAKVINWDLTPVVNTQVTVRLIGTVTS